MNLRDHPEEVFERTSLIVFLIPTANLSLLKESRENWPHLTVYMGVDVWRWFLFIKKYEKLLI